MCHRRGGCLVAVVTRRGIGRDETWDNAVETYPRRPLDREARHQVLEASLCGTVGGSARRWAAAADAADHDDRAALILALHNCVRGLRALQRSDQVQLNDLLMKTGRRRGSRRLRRPAGIANKDIDPAELRLRDGDHAAGLMRIAYIRRAELRVAPIGLRQIGVLRRGSAAA